VNSTLARHHKIVQISLFGFFKAKLKELKDRLMKKDILEKVRAYVYVVEF
jgi:hypothetical protein